MTDPSAAEFYRFVQEAKEQRVRADALAVALAQLKSACLEDIGGRHEEIQCALCLFYWPMAGPPQHDATCVLAADQPAAMGAELLVAIDGLQRRWDAVCRCVDEFEPADMKACDEAKILLDDAILNVLRARSGQLSAGPGREGEQG
jgi:hypothetical protein